MKKMFLLSLLLLSALISRAQLEVPLHSTTDLIFYNSDGRYTFKYIPQYKISHWVAYKLTSSDITGHTERSNNFAVDKSVSSRRLPVATPADYYKSGYDRGHLLPSADRTSSDDENRATFLMSNIAPQLPALNRGTWKNLEQQVRRWAANFDTLYIVCGSIIPPDPQTIGQGVAIPTYFFKAILLRRGDKFRHNCYIMPNNSLLEKDISRYNVSLDSLERFAAIDLIWNNPPN